MLVVAALLLLTVATAVFTLPANAQAGCTASGTYNPSATVTVTPTTVVQGGSVTISGSGWAPNCTLTIALGNGTVSATTDANGNFSIVVSTAELALGSNVATATQGTLSLSTSFTVVGAAVTPTTAPVSTGSLPTTGSNTSVLVSGALALVAVGGLLVLFARKRRGADLAA
jgi:LPXTG-motif cell wall-anchored protein